MVANSASMNDAHFEVIRQSKLFHKIPDVSLVQFLENAEVITYADGDFIVNEGDESQDFFIILDGQVGIYKKGDDTDESYLFTTLEKGDEFGELSLLVKQERSASVRAIGEVTVVVLTANMFQTQSPIQYLSVSNTIWQNLARQLGRRLITTDDVVVKHLKSQLELAKTQNAMAEFIVFITIVMTIFSFIIALLSAESENVAAVDTFSNVGTGVAVFAFLALIYRSPYSFKTFGIYIPDNLLRHIGWALVWSAGLIVVTIIAKWIAILTIPALNDFPLLFIPGQEYPGLEYAASKLTVQLTVGYIVLALVQEIMTRGVIQGVLTEFFKGWRYKHTLAILLSNGLFAVAHLHISPAFAIVTFFTGVMWGIQYVYTPSIIGVWISHAVVGLFGLRLLGLVAMIRILEL